jgi:hypothetical protein
MTDIWPNMLIRETCVREASVLDHAVVLGRGNRHENWGQVMQIGKLVRLITVEPLKLALEQPTSEPEPELTESPEPAPAPDQAPVTA